MGRAMTSDSRAIDPSRYLPNSVFFWILFLAAVVRLWPAIALHGAFADVATEYRRGWAVLQGDNIYASEFPYSPLPQWLPAFAVWASEATGVRFELLFKSILIAADLLSLWWLRGALELRRASKAAVAMGLLLWALNPVAVLVSSVHGNPSSLVAATLVGAWYYLERHRRGRAQVDLATSALLLGMAIALRSFPLLALPALLFVGFESTRDRLSFALFAALPLAVNTGPYLYHAGPSLVANVTSYSGVCDFGWLAALRAFSYLRGGPKLGDFNPHLLALSKLVFLASAALSLTAIAWSRRRDAAALALMPFLLFFMIYGGLSAQYLVWILPLGIIAAPWLTLVFSMVSGVAMVCFYVIYHPGILFGDARPWIEENAFVIQLYAWFNVLLVVVSLVFFSWIVIRELRVERPKGHPRDLDETRPSAHAGSRQQGLWRFSRRPAMWFLIAVSAAGLVSYWMLKGIEAPRGHAEVSEEVAVEPRLPPVPSVGASKAPEWLEPVADSLVELSDRGEIVEPWSVRALPQGGLVVLDFPNRVLQVLQEGKHSTRIELGPDEYLGMDVNAAGEVFVLDSARMLVSVFSAPWDRATREIRLDPAGAFNPRGLAVDDRSHYFVADTGQRRLIEFGPAGETLRATDCGDCGLSFGEISDVATSSEGRVFVADGEHRRVVLLSAAGDFLGATFVPGSGGLEGIRLSRGPDDTVLAASLDQVWKVSVSGTGVRIAGGEGWPYRPFEVASAVAWSGKEGVLWVGDRRARKLSAFRLSP